MRELGSFLATFPDTVVSAVGQLAVDAEVMVADPLTREFRLHPAAALASVRAQFENVRREPPPAAVAWCYEGDAVTGLDRFEVSAVLDRHLEVVRVDEAMAGTNKRIIVVGRPRRHHVIIAVNGDELTDADLAGVLEESQDRQWPGTLLFLGSKRIATICASGALTDQVSALTQSGGTIGLFVPASDTGAACADPDAYLEPFRRSGLSLQAVHFAGGLALEPRGLAHFMSASGLACDTSVPIDSGTAAAGQTVRSGAYAGATPYFPQPFDLRVPSFGDAPHSWVELPMFPVAGATIADWWSSVTWPDDRALIQRLDARRMEEFYRASRVAPELARHYADVRIYNWPRPAPAERVSLLRVPATHLGGIKRSLSELFRRESGVAAAPAGAMVPLARTEATRRYHVSPGAALEVQHATHAYLAEIARSAPLREDYAEFARFIDADLGDAAEIGSGFGLLAWALSPRSRRYICLDLDDKMFSSLRADLGQAGVVADAHALPFADASFDSIIANNVIEHFYDPLAGLSEIRRVLRAGGRLYALLPLDALNSRHDLPAHLWKLDVDSARNAMSAAGLGINRMDVIDLNALGVVGAFPSCNGLAAMVEATTSSGDGQTAPAAPARIAATQKTRSTRTGRVWPSIREAVRFEGWNGRRVLTIEADPDDVEEFRRFGAVVTECAAASTPYPVADGSFDLVYGFLPKALSLPIMSSEVDRVLAPGGAAVMVFSNTHSFRFLSRLRSYFGSACDLIELAGPQLLPSLVEDHRSSLDSYVDADEVMRAFHRFTRKHVRIMNLLPEDLASAESAAYPQSFWRWMDQTFGRFVVVSLAR
jgi:SAM-dependent methyltransferase